ncbi:hypothetical protein [Polyangium fumosum]|uniref:N-acetyltransferase domain-containing protein n=1 Tax=Polyangium fumosum TaxID=889272 RepID=A0A4V5PLV4_9BACT|nr:hypothetical protein [Polyangium fumosum]TKC98165.1 hypothetical protein E8A74_42310 [Polyangium fumosum]
MSEAIELRSPRPLDVAQMVEVCAEAPHIAQHSTYVFWLFATVYRTRSLVAISAENQVVGYLLSMPTTEARTELILQVAVRMNNQARGVGIALLKQHATVARLQGVTALLTSIEVGCKPGESLMRRAIAGGFKYRAVPWPEDADPRPTLGVPEILYRADLLD